MEKLSASFPRGSFKMLSKSTNSSGERHTLVDDSPVSKALAQSKINSFGFSTSQSINTTFTSSNPSNQSKRSQLLNSERITDVFLPLNSGAENPKNFTLEVEVLSKIPSEKPSKIIKISDSLIAIVKSFSSEILVYSLEKMRILRRINTARTSNQHWRISRIVSAIKFTKRTLLVSTHVSLILVDILTGSVHLRQGVVKQI